MDASKSMHEINRARLDALVGPDDPVVNAAYEAYVKYQSQPAMVAIILVAAAAAKAATIHGDPK